QLAGLIKHLKIQDDYDLLGHSWGVMLGSTHAARQPMGLKHLILSGTPASMELWGDAHFRYREGMPSDIREVLMQEPSDDPVYQKAAGEFFHRHGCKSDPVPAELLTTFEWKTKDPTVNLITFGVSDFMITAAMKNWSVIDEIHKVAASTLITNGCDEGADDAAVSPFFERISKVKWVKFYHSAHVPHLEERERFYDVVANFLVANGRN
ncbi:Alpha/Beta hydrolase protein, partial [Umbelopsis sp. PMI_123]